MNVYWAPWIAGMLIPFGFKLGHHLFMSSRADTTYVKAIAEFVFADAAASTTTVLTFSTELLLGSIYIDRLEMPYVPDVELPLNWALCFFLALISESVAPIVVKTIVGFCEVKLRKMFS